MFFDREVVNPIHNTVMPSRATTCVLVFVWQGMSGEPAWAMHLHEEQSGTMGGEAASTGSSDGIAMSHSSLCSPEESFIGNVQALNLNFSPKCFETLASRSSTRACMMDPYHLRHSSLSAYFALCDAFSVVVESGLGAWMLFLGSHVPGFGVLRAPFAEEKRNKDKRQNKVPRKGSLSCALNNMINDGDFAKEKHKHAEVCLSLIQEE